MQRQKEKEQGRFRKKAMHRFVSGTRSVRRMMMSKQKREEVDLALMNAAFANNAAEIRRLIKKGADIAAKSPIGWTALYVAAWEGYTEICILLIKEYARAGGNVKELIAAKDNENLTAMHKAAADRRVETCAMLIERYAKAGGDLTKLLVSSQEKWKNSLTVGGYSTYRVHLKIVPFLNVANLIGTETLRLFMKSFSDCVAA
jgi:ankyrin repeat protein